ncbi:MAG: bacterioferritin [Bacteriovoracaceae bacterium]
MKGDTIVIKGLQQALTNKLTSINQYFLHARIFQNWGLGEIGEFEYKVSIKRMKQADDLIKRILFLEALPNIQKYGSVRIGEETEEIINLDLETEVEHCDQLREAIKVCETKKDYVTRELLTEMLENEEDHIDWMETQLYLIENSGIENYLQSQMKKDD